VTLLRLFGSLDESEAAYRPPTSPLDLRRRARLELPLVLNEMPRLVGPGGHLVVVGVGSDDWLDVETLALSCIDLPAESVHWFDAPERSIPLAELREFFGDRLIHYAGSMNDELTGSSTEEERAALDRARDEILNLAERQVTVRQGAEAKVVRFPPAEWRRLSQVAVVLDDEMVKPPEPLDEERERQAFREFLYRVQRVPDWSGVGRGFLFEREVASGLLDLVEREIAAPRSVHASDAAPSEEASRRSSRLPILVQGPPAAGKSRLLHWLTYELRRRGRVVVFVPSARGRSSFEQIERVCRALEARTEVPCVVVADDLDESDYEQLGEILASSGRRSVVVGAVNSLRLRRSEVGASDGDPYLPSPGASYIPFVLSSRLTDDEADRFLHFLRDRKFPDIALARGVVQQRLFLLLLYRLLPDSRGNIHLAVAQEYERLVRALERKLEGEESGEVGAWQNQLAVIRAQLFPDLETDSQPGEVSPFRHDPRMIGAVQLALFCSQIERPLSLDLLLRSQSSEFLRSYGAFSRAIEETAMLQETQLDAEGAVGVEAEHPFVADVTLRSLLPDRAAQLRLLGPLVNAIRWDESAFPGENPDQDFLVSVFQAVGPRGASGDKFDSSEALDQLVNLLSDVRRAHGARLPLLLLLEANALRLLADRAVSTFEDALERCREAIEILEEAEKILLARRPSNSRNAQLQNVLTTRAVVHGFVSGACLREYQHVEQDERVALRDLLREHLDEVNRDTTRARSMGRASYYPLDVSYWAHRDQLEQLPDLSDEERVSLLAKLETVLEVAAEEPVEAAQYERYQRRLIDLAQLQDRVEDVEALAATLRASGDFSADCILARRKGFDPVTRTVRSPEVAGGALADLLAHAPAILGSEEALVLMHHLWIGAHLGGQQIGSEKPVLARCTRDDWKTWRRILEARLALPANETSPYLNFCLAWTLISLDEPVRAMQILRANEALALGNRRRVGRLAVVTDADGAPVEFLGTVRRSDGQETVLYVPRLMSEIRAPARVQAELAVVVHVGDEWRFGIGLNYQGVLPVPLTT
jgi:hypothetical protein